MNRFKKIKFTRHNRQLLISTIIFTGLIIATIAIIFYGKGYRFGLDNGGFELKGTGLLVAKSIPDGAQVYIDGKLKTATDTTINIPPGQYEVRIAKEGFFPWEKNIKIQTEIVTLAEALLIPTAPRLESITELGAKNLAIDPSLTKIAFTVSSASAKRNGIYVFDMGSNQILTLQGSSTQIIDDVDNEFSEAQISWTPDGNDIIATVSGRLRDTTYLLNTDRPNQPLNNITNELDELGKEWLTAANAQEKALINSLTNAARNLANNHFKIMSISPDQDMVLYTASNSATLPLAIEPRLIGVNSTPEERNIVEGEVYMYDVKEDRNYKMDNLNFTSTYKWLNDSKHIIFIREDAIHIIDFDGLNDTVVYAGPFDQNYLYSWPNSSRIVILTDLGNKTTPQNLYTIILN